MRRILPCLLLAACGGSSSTNVDASATIDGAATVDAAPDAPTTWVQPTCTTITGMGGVTFSHDEGATLVPTNPVLTPIKYTMGLVLLGEPNRMLAGHDNAVWLSRDAGCTWTSIGSTGSETVVLTAAGATRAYGWGDNRTNLVRVDDTTVTTLTAPGDGTILGLAVAGDDPDHVRLGDSAGQLWESTDAGVTWNRLGKAADTGLLAYRVAFAPGDLDHVLVSTAGTGALLTTDGGETWNPTKGTAEGQSGRSNVFTTVFSKADPTIVWAEGIDTSNGDARHVWRSTDGGATWGTVLTQSDTLTLQNGASMFPHPTDPDVVYVIFAMAYQNYGTDVYRYDHASKQVTTKHNPFHRAFAIDFFPGDPSLMYLGVSLEPANG